VGDHSSIHDWREFFFFATTSGRLWHEPVLPSVGYRLINAPEREAGCLPVFPVPSLWVSGAAPGVRAGTWRWSLLTPGHVCRIFWGIVTSTGSCTLKLGQFLGYVKISSEINVRSSDKVAHRIERARLWLSYWTNILPLLRIPKAWVQIRTRRPAVPTEDFFGFSEPFKDKYLKLVHCLVCEGPPLDATLDDMNPVHTLFLTSFLILSSNLPTGLRRFYSVTSSPVGLSTAIPHQ
jgi:hypothetical protein